MSQLFYRLRSPNLPYGLMIVGTLTVALWASIWQSTTSVHGQPAEKVDAEVPRVGDAIANRQEDFAQEILEIQNELGGSVVDKKFPAEQVLELVQKDARRRAATTTGASVPSPTQQIVALRETAWQLESSAHRLEKLDLYEQADSLRQLARRIRQEARDRREQQLAKSV